MSNKMWKSVGSFSIVKWLLVIIVVDGCIFHAPSEPEISPDIVVTDEPDTVDITRRGDIAVDTVAGDFAPLKVGNCWQYQYLENRYSFFEITQTTTQKHGILNISITDSAVNGDTIFWHFKEEYRYEQMDINRDYISTPENPSIVTEPDTTILTDVSSSETYTVMEVKKEIKKNRIPFFVVHNRAFHMYYSMALPEDRELWTTADISIVTSKNDTVVIITGNDAYATGIGLVYNYHEVIGFYRENSHSYIELTLTLFNNEPYNGYMPEPRLITP